MKSKIWLIIWIFGAVQAVSGKGLEVGPGSRYPTIRSAIEAAAPGDEVRVCPGVYQEGRIVIDKPLTLLGEQSPVLDGGFQSEVITVVSDHVTIQGFVIRNVGTSYVEDRAGIRIRKARNFIVSGNKLLNTFFGIYLEHARDGVIEGNIVEGEAVQENNSGNAIHLWYCRNIQVDNNRVSGHRDGIYLEFVDSSRVSKNFSYANIRYGLHFMFSNNDNYFNNRFLENGAGVAVMYSKKINMWDNLFEQNWGQASYGLLLKEIYDASIYRNVFTENTVGIYLESCTRIQYNNNDFIRNGWALKMAGGCLDNAFTGNNFISNTFDLSTDSNTRSNTFDGNFWNEYAGYDLDRNNVGDVPHHPVRLFSYVVNKTPESIVLLRSLFVDLVNLSEKISPVLTPANVADNRPLMHPIIWN